MKHLLSRSVYQYIARYSTFVPVCGRYRRIVVACSFHSSRYLTLSTVNMSSVNLSFPVIGCTGEDLSQYDSVLLVADKLANLKGSLEKFRKPLEQLKQVDGDVEKEVSLLYADDVPGKRLIFSPTGSLDQDTDDVRKFQDAAEKGIKRCLQAGSKSPLLFSVPSSTYKYADLAAVLGALHALYVPLEIREALPDKKTKVSKLGVWGEDKEKLTSVLNLALALEAGRITCRDIGGSDPERMAAPRVAEFVQSELKGSCVKVEVISDQDKIQREYPLLAAVNRAAKCVERHRARVITLTYQGEGPVQQTLMLVGKGVTYDTGGADIKAGGHMAGMHRDKCGAAAVAGFFKTLSILKPKGLKVIGAMAMVRNSVGSDSYVADEILVSRSGVRVRVGNTDAEGRMAMADLLCQMREKATSEVNPHLFTVATLTGHACIAVGDGYTIVLDNGPAWKDKFARDIQDVSEEVGDPFEVSTLRREDYAFTRGKSEYEDVLQCNNAASSCTARGHQFPAAFLVLVSGLDKHGVDSSKPLPYSHLDIAPSSGPFPGVPSGAPILALSAYYIFNRL